MPLEAVGHLTWIWKDVEAPSTSECCVSEKFRYQNIDWCLSMIEDWDSRIELSLDYHYFQSQPRHFFPFVACLLVFRSHGVGREILHHTRRVDVNHSKTLWHQATSELEQIFPGFSRDHLLTFRIQFTEKNPQRRMVFDGNNGWEIQTCYETFADASVQTSLTADSISCLDALSADIGRMLDAESDADLEIQCDGQKIRAHRGVLCSRSPVFARMLQSNMLEGNTGVVKLQDMEADTFRKFMNYLYTGRLDELDHESAVSVYEAADMYGVDRLRKRCSQLLVQNLAVDNACNLLAVADAHGDGVTKKVITRYILDEKIPLSGEQWETFCKTHPSLANEVYGQYVQLLVDSECPCKKRRVW